MQSTDQIRDSAVDDGLAPKLRQSVVSLVRAKAQMDRLAHEVYVDLNLVGKQGLCPGEDGTSFYQAVFPFYGRWVPSGPSVVLDIPLELTIGNSWKWQPKHVKQDERTSLLETFQHCEDGPERAQVCWIVPLGIFLAHEGKNRVAFLRSEGATYYPALTTPYDYPPPDRLLLIQVEGPHGDEWWAVLDQDFIETLCHPEWVLSVLDAYGVRTVRGWPTDFPSYSALRKAVAYRRRKNVQHLSLPPVSLKDLLSKEEKKAEMASASFMELRDVRLKRGWKRAFMALAATFLVAISVAQPKLHELSILSAGMGAILMLPILFLVEILLVPRRHIDPDNK